MRLDRLIQKRFAELEEKAKTVSESREKNFVTGRGEVYYKIAPPVFTAWATSVLSLLQRVFGEDGVHYQRFSEHYEKVNRSSYTYDAVNTSGFEVCCSIFQSAKEDYEGGYLFNVRALVKAEVLDDALEQAEEILNAGYKDPACVVIGVALETTLKEMCTRAGVSHSKLDGMNIELRKAGIYNMAKQKQITAWADLRNNAAHGKWSEYNDADVKDFLEGVHRFLADFF